MARYKYRFEDSKFVSAVVVEEEVLETPTQEILLTPEEIKDSLDQYIIGQEDAKILLSTAIFNHSLRRVASFPDQREYYRIPDEIELEKGNVLLLGPTGCGKTYCVSQAAKILKLPFVSCSSTTITTSGYVGDDVVNILERLLDSAYEMMPPWPGQKDLTVLQNWHDQLKALVEWGIVYIDEIDKLAASSGIVHGDVSTTSVQEDLLTFVEGTDFTISTNSRFCKSRYVNRGYIDSDRLGPIKTHNILVIAGGAFSKIKPIIDKRLNKKSTGFHAPISSNTNVNIYTNVIPDDIVEYGMLPEFVGRFPNLGTLKNLTQQNLYDILTTKTNNLIAQWKIIFRMSRLVLEFEERAIKKIAKVALETNLGARGLNGILDRTLRPLQFKHMKDRQFKEVVVTEKHIKC